MLKKTKIRKISSVIGVIAVSISLIACGAEEGSLESMSKEELITMYNNVSTNYNDLYAEYQNYKALNEGMMYESDGTPIISSVGDGTGKLTFNSIDHKVIFPAGFEYPNAEQIRDDSRLYLTDTISISPTNNWICRLSGPSVELENDSISSSSGQTVSGTIKVGRQSYAFTADELQTQVLDAWFEGLPPSSINYTKIYVGQYVTGVQATTPTTIDSEDAYLRCGMFYAGDYCVTYIFVYRGTVNQAYEESISNLLNSMLLDGSDLNVTGSGS